MKTALLSGLMIWLFVSAVLAADGAKFRALGFSPDDKFFAFEQYGVQDGSGFAYDEIFILDIAKDAWVNSTPIKVLVEDETGSVAPARIKAKAQAKDLLAKAGITADAEILGGNPFTEVITDRSQILFHDHYNNGMGMFGNADNQGTWLLKASPLKVPVNAECDSDMDIVGYKLEIKNNKTAATQVIHEDKSVPKSRFCPLGYDIEAIVQQAGGSQSGQLIAIVGVSSRGFEGADRRFIAVPFKMN